MTHLAVIGAAGNMGSYTARALAPHCEKISVLDDEFKQQKLEKPLRLSIAACSASLTGSA